MAPCVQVLERAGGGRFWSAINLSGVPQVTWGAFDPEESVRFSGPPSALQRLLSVAAVT